MELTTEQENTLKTLCESHSKLSFRALEVMLVACAIAFLFMKDRILIEEASYIWVVLILGIAAYKIAYSKSKTYQSAKKLQYSILTVLVYITGAALLVCQQWWIALSGLALCSFFYFSMPNPIDMENDFGDDEKNAQLHI